MAAEVAVAWGRPEGAPDVGALLLAARGFGRAQEVEVQLLDAASVASSDHLRSAAAHALRAKERGAMRTSSLGMETLLYAAGRRQIRDAMALMGISAATERLAAVLIGPGASAKARRLPAALGLETLSEKRAAGGASALERLGVPTRGAAPDQLPDLALEQVALLDIEK